ncbi:MAG: hypothetical protein QE271_09415 [Bacteriovoracaceae bacterium]|nr:hypothetical protein [Bacteriovoracaceae bacterium]
MFSLKISALKSEHQENNTMIMGARIYFCRCSLVLQELLITDAFQLALPWKNINYDKIEYYQEKRIIRPLVWIPSSHHQNNHVYDFQRYCDQQSKKSQLILLFLGNLKYSQSDLSKFFETCSKTAQWNRSSFVIYSENEDIISIPESSKISKIFIRHSFFQDKDRAKPKKKEKTIKEKAVHEE